MPVLPALPQTSHAESGANTPAAAAQGTAQPQTPGVAGTPGAAAAPTPNAEHQKVCAAFVAILSGKTSDEAPGSADDVNAMAMSSPDLITCGAVVNDSDATCKKFMPEEKGPGRMCVQTRAIFHELRTYPKGSSFFLDDAEWEEWQPMRPVAGDAMDALRAALRAGDIGACTKAGDLSSVCQAYMKLDPSLCTVTGKLATAQVELPSRGVTVDVKSGLEEGCKQNIKSRAFLAKGLKGLAESGPTRERAFAKAALGDAEACAVFAKGVVDACMVKQAQPEQAPIGETPGGPASATPKSGGPPPHEPAAAEG